MRFRVENAPLLSIVTVSCSVCDDLRRCLRSLFQDDGRDVEVVVVDNASADRSATMVEREFPQVRLIANDRNRGFAAVGEQSPAWNPADYPHGSLRGPMSTTTSFGIMWLRRPCSPESETSEQTERQWCVPTFGEA